MACWTSACAEALSGSVFARAQSAHAVACGLDEALFPLPPDQPELPHAARLRPAASAMAGTAMNFFVSFICLAFPQCGKALFDSLLAQSYAASILVPRAEWLGSRGQRSPKVTRIGHSATSRLFSAGGRGNLGAASDLDGPCHIVIELQRPAARSDQRSGELRDIHRAGHQGSQLGRLAVADSYP